MADSFLVLVPHKTLHGTISILIQRPKLATNVGKMGAVKNKMPFIPQCPGPAQSAAAEMPGDGRFSKPTLFHRQGMRPHAELHQQPHPGNGHWKLKVRHSKKSNYHAAVVDGMEQSNNSEQQVQASEPTAVPQVTFGEQRLCP